MRIANRTILPKFPDLVRIYFATTVCLSPHFNEHEVNFHMHVEKVKKNYQKVVKIYLKVGPRIEKLIISQWSKLNEALELLSDED